MRKYLFVSLPWLNLRVCAVLLLFLLSACQPQSPPPVKIGLIPYLEGSYRATSGLPTLRAAQLAANQVNQSGGVQLDGQQAQVELIVAEISDSPEEAVMAVEKLINQHGVSAIIGPQFSRDAIPSGQIAEEAGIPLLSPMSTNPATTAGRAFVFRVGFSDDFQGPALARFAYHDLQKRRAAVLYDISSSYNSNLAQAFEAAFTALGGEIVAAETYTSDANQDFLPQLERIAPTQPEILFLPNYTADVRLQGRQARQVGLTAVFLGGDGWGAGSLAPLDYMDGAYHTQHWHPKWEMNGSQAFSQAYQAAYGEAPNTDAALAYDAMSMLIQALAYSGSSDPAAIQKALYAMPEYHGVSGDIRYRNSGDPQKTALIVQYKDGESWIYATLTP